MTNAEPRNPLDLPRLHMTDEEWEAFTDAAPFVTYEMADGSLVWSEYKFVTNLDGFRRTRRRDQTDQEDVSAALSRRGCSSRSVPDRG